MEDCRIGMEVVFGRNNGEKTRGVVVKLNSKTAKVRVLENRGKSNAGAVWGVGYGLLQPSLGGTNTQPSPVENPLNVKPVAVNSRPIVYNQFQDHTEQLIMEAINNCYSQLSPEWLTCDGEAPANLVRQRADRLNRILRGLFQALGQHVDEMTAYQWWEDKQKQKQIQRATP
jgi:hypothetical protein